MELIQFLKSNENARKIFGQRELKIIEKQVNGVSLSQSEKNRLSRDIRKKFQFIKEISKFSQEFELKRGSLIKSIIEDTKKIILEDKEAKKIKRMILFGSITENKLTLNSDIDIAIEFKNIAKKEAILFRARVSGRVSKKIDIQVFNVLPQKIKKEINKRGKIIYGNE